MSLKNLHSLPDSYLRGQPRFAAQTFHPINPRGHAHFAQRAALSRRGFLGMTAAASGLLFGGLAAPSVAEAARKGSSTPKPIPGGIQPLGPGTEIFHINLPAPGFEPSLITDFNGEVGVANVGGHGTQTDTNTNTSKRLAFDVDVRFMRGVYVGEDGRVHRNAFVFVWLDVYEGPVDPAHQIHDFNPGIAENGLFWTIPLPESSLDVHFGKGTGSLHVSGLDVEDYHDIVNALLDGPSVEATVSFDIHWLGATDRFELRDAANRFAGQYVHTPATIAWAATESGIQFVSDPADTSVNELSLIGHEHNGVFFTGE